MPDVTAICVTRGDRDKVRLALRTWEQQTVLPRLLFVHQGLDYQPPAHPLIQCVEVHKGATLGELHNVGLDTYTTPFWCKWDDDDWRHPVLVERQLERLKETPEAWGCCLLRWTLYDQITDRAWVTWRRPWEGSIMARRGGERFATMRIGEDTEFFERIKPALVLLDNPALYVYRCHGRNTYNREHFMGLARRSDPTESTGLAQRFEDTQTVPCPPPHWGELEATTGSLPALRTTGT